MTDAQLLQEISALSPEAQKLVLDLVRYLNREGKSASLTQNRSGEGRLPLRDEPFFGMWKDREEMADSVEYVRNLRRSQWNRNSE